MRRDLPQGTDRRGFPGGITPWSQGAGLMPRLRSGGRERIERWKGEREWVTSRLTAKHFHSSENYKFTQ